MSLNVKTCKGGIQFSAAIQPRASKNEITGVFNGALKIRLTAPPVEGEANRSCVKFLAKSLGVSASRIDIVAGVTSKNKIIHIDSMDASTFLQKVLPQTS
ncbi:MAG: UPF0235 protein [Nitrospinaceae bacterium]|nr:MAG: UPF0235 protein [Nitrospinaceae bacterium]